MGRASLHGSVTNEREGKKTSGANMILLDADPSVDIQTSKEDPPNGLMAKSLKNTGQVQGT